MATASLSRRLIRVARPTPVADYAPAPICLDSGLWVLDRRFRFPGGLLLPTRTTLVGLSGGGLLVVSPPPVEAGGLEELDALGRVREVVAPNTFHYLALRGFAARYPDAVLHLAPGLSRRVVDLPAGRELDDGASWSADLEHAVLRPHPQVSEVVFFHRASATLIVTDLAFHMTRYASALQRAAWRLSGIPAGFGPSRTARFLLLHDRERSRAFLSRVLEWPFRRIVAAHGEALDVEARSVFRRAFAAWLGDD